MLVLSRDRTPRRDVTRYTVNIFLLSVTNNLNTGLKSTLSQEISNYGHKIAYVSSAKQIGEKKYYLSTVEDFKKINSCSEVDYFDLSSDFSDQDLEKLKNYKIIYLSGGNTFTFLNDSKNRELGIKLQSKLSEILLIGASAGSIMMTPRIDICSICDSNNFNLQDLSSFNFTPFEFHPHFTEGDLGWLQNYKKNKRTSKILACKDGDGVQYKDNLATLLGEVTTI